MDCKKTVVKRQHKLRGERMFNSTSGKRKQNVSRRYFWRPKHIWIGQFKNEGNNPSQGLRQEKNKKPFPSFPDYKHRIKKSPPPPCFPGTASFALVQLYSNNNSWHFNLALFSLISYYKSNDPSFPLPCRVTHSDHFLARPIHSTRLTTYSYWLRCNIFLCLVFFLFPAISTS